MVAHLEAGLAYLARLVSSIQTIMSQTRLLQAVADGDWVLTGEGCFDEQSLRGKVVSGVTRVAREAVAWPYWRYISGRRPRCTARPGLRPRKLAWRAARDYGMTRGDTLRYAARRFVREHLFV